MSQVMVVVVDYGMGNHASVIHCLRDLGFRVRVSAEIAVLDSADVLLLPGVGAFPAAMQSLHQRGLVDYLQRQAREQRPIIGICLGMQLLTSASHEFQYTAGLDIIPGEFVALFGAKWHTGWNTLECVGGFATATQRWADVLFQSFVLLSRANRISNGLVPSSKPFCLCDTSRQCDWNPVPSRKKPGGRPSVIKKPDRGPAPCLRNV